jgi:putative flippase GtrA
MVYRIKAEFLRWAIVAATTFVLDTFLFACLYLFFNNVFIANSVSFLISTLYNFFFHKHWTYQNSDSFSSPSLRYFGLLIVSFVINSVLISIFLLFNDSSVAAKVFASMITLVLNYVGLRNFVFTKSQ